MKGKTVVSKAKEKTRKSSKAKDLPLSNEVCDGTVKQKHVKQKEGNLKKQKRQNIHKEQASADVPPPMNDASCIDESLKSAATDSSGSKVLTLRTSEAKASEVPQFYGRRYAAQKLLLKPPRWYYRRKKKGIQTKTKLAVNLWNFIKKLTSFVKARASMFQSLKFTEFMISNFLLFAFNDIFYVNLPEYVTMALNVSEQQASWLVPITGVANTLSIPLFGALADSQRVNNCLCYGVCTIISGICILALPFVHSYSGICGLCAVFGLFVSASASLTAIIVVELLSFEQFVGAFGTLHLMQGIGNLAGTPFAGALYDWTGSYTATFFTGGSGLILSGILAVTSEMTPKRITPDSPLNKNDQIKDIVKQIKKQEKTLKKELVLHDAVPFDDKNEQAQDKALADHGKDLRSINASQKKTSADQANVHVEPDYGAQTRIGKVLSSGKREEMLKVHSWIKKNDELDKEKESSCEGEDFGALRRKKRELHTECKASREKKAAAEVARSMRDTYSGVVSVSICVDDQSRSWPSEENEVVDLQASFEDN
ncbi:hypothetical protein D918_07912 [Trichuris suis]|nr:hypothetical protein D918_07912 [Trichuris suis]